MVTWEDCDRPAQEIYFETDETFAADLTCNPHTFLIACVMPAMDSGEKRVRIDAEICPQLLVGLITAMDIIRHWWYKRSDRIPRIEARTRIDMPPQSTHKRAGMFFSGGIDSLATLRSNRVNFPLEHPWAIKDGLIVFGLETERIDKFAHVFSSLSDFAREADITLIPVYTNVRALNDDWMFWQHKFQDSVYASVAHAFVRRFSVTSIASTYDIPHMQPDGSHPLLDINYSSSDLQIRHDNINMSRFEKIKLVAEWDLGLQNIRTCNRSELYEQGVLNCGECWKCVSAMLGLLSLGVLEKTRAFPPDKLSEGLLQSVIKIYRSTLCIYDELETPLREKGYHGFADVIGGKIEKYQKIQELSDFKKALNVLLRTNIKRFDRKYLKGRLRKYIVQKRKERLGDTIDVN